MLAYLRKFLIKQNLLEYFLEARGNVCINSLLLLIFFVLRCYYIIVNDCSSSFQLDFSFMWKYIFAMNRSIFVLNTGECAVNKSIHRICSIKKARNFKFYFKETSTQVSSCKFCKIFKNIFFAEHLQATFFNISNTNFLVCALQLNLIVSRIILPHSPQTIASRKIGPWANGAWIIVQRIITPWIITLQIIAP